MLEVIHSYLTKLKQIEKFTLPSVYGEFYSQVFHKGQSQDHLNIYICDMFFEIPENTDFGRYANNNNPYTYCSKIEHVLTNPHKVSKKLIYQFSENHLVANAGECQPLTNSNLPADMRIANTEISNEE